MANEGELHRVAQQVEENLFVSLLVEPDSIGYALRNENIELDLLLDSLELHDSADVPCGLSHIKDFRTQLEPIAFYLAEIQRIIDNVLQVQRRVEDDF